MKLTIDTERKVIELDEAVDLAEFILECKRLLGEDWKQYSLEPKTGWTYYPYIPWTPPYNPYTDTLSRLTSASRIF